MHLVCDAVIKEAVHVPPDQVHRGAAANFTPIGLPECAEHRASCLQGIRLLVAEDEFTVLGFAEVRSPQLVIVSQDWTTRIRVNDGPVERSTARCSVSVPPEVAQFPYLARDDEHCWAVTQRLPPRASRSELLSEPQVAQRCLQAFAYDPSVAKPDFVYSGMPV